MPPPHVLALHLQFYSALILLHRPFLPAQRAQRATEVPSDTAPSHSIATTSAHAIANIAKTFSDKYTLRQCPPFLVYPLFAAAQICVSLEPGWSLRRGRTKLTSLLPSQVYNAEFSAELARPAKAHLATLMAALKEMEVPWSGAGRQWDVLHDLVDLHDEPEDWPATSAATDRSGRGVKRGSESTLDVKGATFSPQSTFSSAPLLRPVVPPARPRRSSSAASNKMSRVGGSATSLPVATSPTIPEHATLGSALFGGTAMPPSSAGGSIHTALSPSTQMDLDVLATYPFNLGTAPASWDIFGPEGATDGFDLAHFRAEHQDQPQVDYSQLLNSFMSQADPSGLSPAGGPQTRPAQPQFDYGAPGFGVASEEWQNCIPQAFSMDGLTGQGQGHGGTPQGGYTESPM